MAASGSETPRLDAELLLGHALLVGRTSILAQPEVPLSEAQSRTFTQLVERRATGEPVAYIRGMKEFFGLAFSTDARALIPRPETETLVQLALDRVQAMLVAAPRPPGTAALRVWDIGTGSGAIAVVLAVEFRRRGYADEVRVRATDLSPDALALATENAVAHGVADVIEFAIADLAASAPDADVVVANLPYVPSSVLPGLPVAASFEPRMALDGGPGGLELVARLLEQLPGVVAPAGAAMLEIGGDQSSQLGEISNTLLPDWPLLIHDDLSGTPRVAELSRPPEP